MAKLYTYMIGIEPSDWDFTDAKACKKYGLECKGYYKLGNNEGMILVGELDNIEDIMELYFGLEIVDEYLCPIDEFDWEDGEWITGGWKESKKSAKKSIKELRIMTKHLKEAISDKTITINHHDYLLSGYGDSKNYKVDIIPDYDIFEEGMACDCTVDCYDYGDKASSPYTNMIGVHYKVWITPSGKTKSKLVLDETELIDKDDFDYLDDSVFVMICEWIDNRYGKELFESKKSARKSIKESSFSFIVEVDKGDLKIREAIKDIFDEFKNKKDYRTLTWKSIKEGLSFSGDEDEVFAFQDYLLDHIYEYGDYELDRDYMFVESKKSARKSLKESSDVVEKISSEIDKSYWIDKLIDDLDRHYESMEKAWLKNLDKLSDEDILGIVDDCMGKSKTLVGKSEMLKNKMIDDLSKVYDDYIDDIDRQIRIGKSEDEVKDMIETTLENDIKMYLKLAYNNKASSNYFMVKFAEDNLI